MRKLLCTAAFVALAGCTNGALDQARVQVASGELIAVCNTAMALAGFSGPMAPWIIAGCGSAEGLVKLASDPGSVAWVNGLIADVHKLNGG